MAGPRLCGLLWVSRASHARDKCPASSCWVTASRGWCLGHSDERPGPALCCCCCKAAPRSAGRGGRASTLSPDGVTVDLTEPHLLQRALPGLRQHPSSLPPSGRHPSGGLAPFPAQPFRDSQTLGSLSLQPCPGRRPGTGMLPWCRHPDRAGDEQEEQWVRTEARAVGQGRLGQVRLDR